ncbi:threonine/serine exporter family protein [Nocardioides pantholopis]|uniref:threonine/serine exporter family protein n=1 Tax=Nocardioides pantholopis TaxID=2483798 RepID=UPI0021E10FA6|nr:threonine/serine exporter family protein [Nocardioides pantholopis]
MLDTREVNLTLDFCLRVGELLLSSGAGAADVAATMQLVSRHLGLRNADIDVTFTSLSMSHQPTPRTRRSWPPGWSSSAPSTTST